MHKFNGKHNIIPYEYHEYYHPNIYNSHGLPMIEPPQLDASSNGGTTKVRLEFESRVNRNLSVYWVNTRNQKEYFQESLDANTWSITKARSSFNSHIFVIRDALSNEWIATYKNGIFHRNVLITVTPFGVCVRDQSKAKNTKMKVNDLLNLAKQKRWSSDADILTVWQLYEEVLWLTSDSKIVGKVLNLMGQIFLYGAFDQMFDYNIAWRYFKMAAMLSDGDAMYNMAYMIEQKLLPMELYTFVPTELYQNAMLNYWCAAQAKSEKAQLLLGFRYSNAIGMNQSCHHSLFFYQKLAEKGMHCVVCLTQLTQKTLSYNLMHS